MCLPGHSLETTLVLPHSGGVAAWFWTEGGDHGNPHSWFGSPGRPVGASFL